MSPQAGLRGVFRKLSTGKKAKEFYAVSFLLGITIQECIVGDALQIHNKMDEHALNVLRGHIASFILLI